MEYKRDDAVTALASLREGHAFLKALPANAATAPATASASANASANAATAPAAASASTPVTEHARLRAAARAGSAAAAAILLRRHPDLARCPQHGRAENETLVSGLARHGRGEETTALLEKGGGEGGHAHLSSPFWPSHSARALLSHPRLPIRRTGR
eukprot:scaffold31810_cov84-Isochrysis_galbana.AAC.1